MKIQEKIIDREKVIQIYLSEEEKDCIDVQEEINKLRMQNVKVVLFVSGNQEANYTLKEMVNIMRENVV